MKKFLLLFLSAIVCFSVLTVCACQGDPSDDGGNSSDGKTSVSQNYDAEEEQSDGDDSSDEQTSVSEDRDSEQEKEESSRTDYYGPNV